MRTAVRFGLLLLAVAPVMAAEEPDVFDRVWSHATLWETEEHSIALSGRLQLDSAWFDADQGEFEDTLWRRFRFGFKTVIHHDWVIHVEADFDLNESLNDVYNRLTDAYVGWSPRENLELKALKHSVGFTLDGATSSKKLLTPQRSNLANNLWFTAEYFTGVSVSGTAADKWRYKAGLFSSDGNDELSRFDAGIFGMVSLGRDISECVGLERAVVRVDYVYNEEDVMANTRDFSQVASVVTQWEGNRWGVWTDLAAGKGYLGQSDIWGLSAMPFYDVTDHVQVVLRYTHLSSSEDNGLRLGRYEGEISSGRGDRYDELLAGLNLFFYGHKLKWQTALQHTDMEDAAADGGAYAGWGLTTALRLSW